MESYIIDFDINEPSNLTVIMPVISLEGTPSHTCLHYTQDDLMTGIWSLN